MHLSSTLLTLATATVAAVHHLQTSNRLAFYQIHFSPISSCFCQLSFFLTNIKISSLLYMFCYHIVTFKLKCHK